jgi:hypothetical protein
MLCYVGHGLVTGRTFGRYNTWGRTFQRDADPWLYWSTLVAYSVLAVALFFFFGKKL